MIDIVALGVDLKCPHKIHLNTQCPPPLGLLDLPKALHILVIFKHLQGQSLLYCSTIAKKKDASLRLCIGIGILLTY